ncbi:hypothetical protein [Cryobacterium cryoconiti]|uniref:variant leucine-rich repeat-containing protein n=1 Tax=Cryobacterium cryoconiti TaxID=1259239 RepID=UPI00141AD0AF|nr:hypothetical protein [Cryobacterium cryoconiti]
MSDIDNPIREAADPQTPQARLAEIAAAHPELHPVIATNPACYPGLLDWMRASGTLTDAPTDVSVPADQVPADQVPADQVPADQVPVATPARRKRGLIIGGSIALVAVLVGGAGIWAYGAVFSKLGGAATPEAAVEQLLTGAADLDPIAVYGALSPAEIESLKAPLERLGDVKLDADADDDTDYKALTEELIAEITISVTDLEFSVEEIADGVAAVSVESGELKMDGDPETIAGLYVDLVRPQLTAQLTDYGYSKSEIKQELADARDSAEDELTDFLPYSLTAGEMADDLGRDPSIVAVEEDGDWFVSPLLTLGETLYQTQSESDSSVTRGSLIAPSDADSFATPEEAAEGFAEAIAAYVGDGEASGLAAALPLPERRLMSLYGDLFEYDGYGSLTLAEFSVTSKTDGDRARMMIDEGIFEGDGSYLPDSIEIAGVCGTISAASSSSQTGCLDEIPGLDELGVADMRVIAVREGDGWFVSPLETLFDATAIAVDNAARLSDEGKLTDIFASAE